MKLSKDRKETIAATVLAIVTVLFIYVMLFYVGDNMDQWIPE
nr:MAG TPA: hypothetical protein [Caudoviricetes sp.]